MQSQNYNFVQSTGGNLTKAVGSLDHGQAIKTSILRLAYSRYLASIYNKMCGEKQYRVTYDRESGIVIISRI